MALRHQTSRMKSVGVRRSTNSTTTHKMFLISFSGWTEVLRPSYSQSHTHLPPKCSLLAYRAPPPTTTTDSKEQRRVPSFYSRASLPIIQSTTTGVTLNSPLLRFLLGLLRGRYGVNEVESRLLLNNSRRSEGESRLEGWRFSPTSTKYTDLLSLIHEPRYHLPTDTSGTKHTRREHQCRLAALWCFL